MSDCTECKNYMACWDGTDNFKEGYKCFIPYPIT